jgi:streptogramin lyase
LLRLAALALVTLGGTPLAFTQPTSIEVEPSGKLLVVENNPGRVLSVDPANGRVTVLARSLVHPYSVVRAPSGAVFVSVGTAIRRLGGGVVVRSRTDIGPLALARDGTLYYATGAGVFRVGRGRLASRVKIGSAHGLVVTRDGAVLVSDTDGNRIVRIARDGTASTFATVTSPRGIDVAGDGTVYVVDPVARRIVHLAAGGRSLGFRGPALSGDPYDVQVAHGGSLFVLEAGQVGDVRVIDVRGHVTVLSRG